jgi:hypothetical protein
MSETERAIFAAAFARGALDGIPGTHTYEDASRAVQAVVAWRVFRGRRERGPVQREETEAIMKAADE